MSSTYLEILILSFSDKRNIISIITKPFKCKLTGMPEGPICPFIPTSPGSPLVPPRLLPSLPDLPLLPLSPGNPGLPGFPSLPFLPSFPGSPGGPGGPSIMADGKSPPPPRISKKISFEEFPKFCIYPPS